MKTDIDLKQDLYDYIMSSILSGAVSGRVLIRERSPKSVDEDIVVSVLSSNVETDIQTALLHVNIYVKDLHTDEGQAVEDGLRLRELSRMAVVVLAVGHGASGYRFELVSQRIFKVEGREEHCINNRILYKQLIKQ